jgi:LuxR family maltose regulon positive regulatory protein
VVVGDASAPGRETLEYLEQANLFIVPLDNERRWYRYHHLFAELLRQRLRQGAACPAAQAPSERELHIRASAWHEEQGLELEAFQHAGSAGDVVRAERLIAGGGAPLYVRGGTTLVLNWLASLPTPVLDARPGLWVTWGTALSIAGHVTRVEPTLQAAEAALRNAAPDESTRELTGRIAGLRGLLALLAADASQFDAIIAQSRRVLEQLPLDNLRERASTTWKLGFAYQLQGARSAAQSAFIDAIAASEACGNRHVAILATTGLGKMQEADNQLEQAAATYRRVLQLVGAPPGPVACEACVGLARIHYEWNDLAAARQYGQQSVQLARQIDIASFVSSELFLAQLQLAHGDVTGALAALGETERAVRQRQFWFWLPQVAAAQAQALLRHGNLAQAEQVARAHVVPSSLARVHLAQGDACAALTVLTGWRQQVEAKSWADDRLKGLVLTALAQQALGDQDTALCVLDEALALAEPGGFIRLFVDEGAAMAELLTVAMARGAQPRYVGALLAACAAEAQTEQVAPQPPARASQQMVEPLSRRELEVLRLIADGLSNREIGERLFLALDTVKGHNRVLFSKLLVQRRTEAVARARELGLL